MGFVGWLSLAVVLKPDPPLHCAHAVIGPDDVLSTAVRVALLVFGCAGEGRRSEVLAEKFALVVEGVLGAVMAEVVSECEPSSN